MGIVNVTPDSFADGGRFLEPDEAVKHAARLIAAGADILDVGGESTRPGAAEVPTDQELDRVIPVIELLTREFDVPVSIDTSKAIVMREAVTVGAVMVNDVCALESEDALATVAGLEVAVCLVHMQGRPRSMQDAPGYADVTEEVCDYLRKRAEACLAAGIHADNIIIDPGFGFGKTLEHNLQLLRELDRLVEIGFPVLVGLSRKSMLGTMIGRDVHDRLAGSLALALLAAQQGAAIFRVHDVAPTVDVLRVLRQLNNKYATH
ncbi:MAG: dihydropteroate synthase [Chromatiales bacterium]|jgi:dihydropteroate synthase|nr:dihydropteroate synthase [Chromatiales bacterium]